MPVMRRIDKKAEKIAFKIMGTPPNIAFKRNKEQQRINKRLIFEETVRAR